MSADPVMKELRIDEIDRMKAQLAKERRDNDIRKIIHICLTDPASMEDMIRNEVDEGFVKSLSKLVSATSDDAIYRWSRIVQISLQEMAERYAYAITQFKNYEEDEQ